MRAMRALWQIGDSDFSTPGREIKALGFDERFKRMWEYYLAYCQVGFDIRVLDVGLYKLARNANSSGGENR